MPLWVFRYFLLLFLSLSWTFMLGIKVQAQQPAPSVVSAVRFEGTPLYPTPQLQSYLRTQANRRFFNLPNITPWLWIYKRGEKSKLPNRIKNAILKSGDKPALLEASAVQTDTTRLRIFYQQQGYRWARICPEIRALNASKSYVDSIRAQVFNLQNGAKSVKCNLPPPSLNPKVNVVFHVYLGERLYVRSYRYEGLNHLDAADRLACISNSLLNTSGNQNLNFTFKAEQSQPYDEPLLYSERRRLVNCLQSRGYAQMTRDSVLAIAYTQADSLEIALQAQTGRRYKTGNINFIIEGQEEETYLKLDTLWEKDGFYITTVQRNESHLTADYPKELLKIYPNNWYNQSKLLESKSALDQTGLFSFSTFEPQFDQQYQDQDGNWILPVTFSLNTQQRLNLNSNASLIQGTGGNTLTGIQTGVQIANNNTRGKGEQLSFNLSAAIAFNTKSFFQSGSSIDDRFPHRQIEGEITWAFPYLKKRLFRLAQMAKIPTQNMRTQLVLNTLLARQNNYYSIIRRTNFKNIVLYMRVRPS